MCAAFVNEAARSGVDIFRIFDALNDVSQMRPAIDAVLNTGTTIAEVAMAYSGDLTDPNEKLYTLDYYLKLAEQIVDSGAHILAVKDMAGLMKPAAATKLVSELRKNFDLPVHVHTHDTAGGQLATYWAAAAAGADAVDGASAPLSGTTSQPSLSAIVAAFDNTYRSTGLSLDAVGSLEPYWEAVRKLYAPFESGTPGPTGRVYLHEIPGGQLSNLRAQAIALGLADRFELIEDTYAAVNEMLGRPTKVTPSSKVVGDLALYLVGAGVDPKDFAADPQKYDIPDSVIAFLRGELELLPVAGQKSCATRPSPDAKSQRTPSLSFLLRTLRRWPTRLPFAGLWTACCSPSRHRSFRSTVVSSVTPQSWATQNSCMDWWRAKKPSSIPRAATFL